MEIVFENLAKAGNGSVKINDLTVIYGPNNSGKTYINYAIFSILDNMESYFDLGLSDKQLQESILELKSNGTTSIDVTKKIKNFKNLITKIAKNVVNNFPDYFSLHENYFSELKISLIFDKIDTNKQNEDVSSFNDELFIKFNNESNEKIIVLTLNKNGSSSYIDEKRLSLRYIIRTLSNLIVYSLFLKKFIPIPFPITSERTGVSLFCKIFDNRNDEIAKIITTKDEMQNFALVQEMHSHYALPIQKNIELVRFFEERSKKSSFLVKDTNKYKGLLAILSKLLDDGTFSSANGSLFYHPNEPTNIERGIPLHATSSSIKALFTLDVFVKHIATPEHILVIDEPELNLHPENQVLMARLVARLVNAGIKVSITTHSDFFVRELNNLVMLNSADEKLKKNILKEHDFSESEILDHKRVSAYNTTKNRIVEAVEVDRFGINSTMFDDVFNKENKKRQDVYLGMEKVK